MNHNAASLVKLPIVNWRPLKTSQNYTTLFF